MAREHTRSGVLSLGKAFAAVGRDLDGIRARAAPLGVT
jgi:hypothetical protein